LNWKSRRSLEDVNPRYW